MKIRNLVITATVCALVLAVSGCDAKSDAMAEIAQDFGGTLQDKLGASADDILSEDASEFNNANAYEGTYYICTDSDMPAIESRVYDNADEAREYFEGIYDIFSQAYGDGFDGDCQYALNDNSGYIVVDGPVSGGNIFGERYMFGDDLYAGLYYYDNAVIVITPRNDAGNSEVEDVISRLGLPMANGENT